MPSYGLPHVKCEPLSESDEEDISSHLVHSYHALKQASSTSLELRRVKHEPDSSTSDDNVPNDILRHLQQPTSLEELAPPAPPAPSATPVCIKQEPADCSIDTLESASHAEPTIETLESTPHTSSNLHLERHLSLLSSELQSEFMPLIPVKDEPSSEGEQAQLSSDETSDSCSAAETINRTSPKSWTQQDMDNALEALRKHNMSLTKASATYGIPSTTLWQRAHRLGIDTPKKEGSSKSWSEADLRGALHALRAGAISANKASKAYGIPSSTLYKIARREGIRLAAPFNAAPTSWRPSDLERALDSIRSGHNSVQRASAQFGIPTGTLYGRCKREGIELSRSNPTPWSEDAMGEALEAVRVGQMSINQAAIHYNLPYSSLYGRFKRCKYPQSPQQIQQQGVPECPEMEQQNQTQEPPYQQYHQQNIQMSHTMHPHPEHNLNHMNAMHYHTNTMHHHMPDSSVNAQMHDPSMLTNVMLHEEAYSQPAMYYSQAHTNGITTS